MRSAFYRGRCLDLATFSLISVLVVLEQQCFPLLIPEDAWMIFYCS